MKHKSILKIIIWGGAGAIIIGMITDQWLLGIIFCLVIAIINEKSSNKET